MNMTTRHTHIRTCLFIACFVLLLGSTSVSFAQTPAVSTGGNGQVAEPVPINIEKNISTFEYQIEGRPDPFLPFISERSTTNENPDEIIDENVSLTGMQLFEPGQLTLVGLVIAGNRSFAMVQDFTGKGYVIQKGTKIGRRGIVSDIIENKVLIEETALTRGGKTLTNQVAMVLKKEGEE